ncbi:MAG: NADP oxidoreductase [Planctomycetes bacterium]|nr:NADP oxidoreductase [Planctomycetota bacterium]
MSILDIDERILDLAKVVEFSRSPINDLKKFDGRCAVGIVEGGCANEENVEVLREFRRKCDILVSLGDCATMGGIPALRNSIPLSECLETAYLDGPTVVNPLGRIPSDEEIPLLLDKVYPCHEIVKIDLFLPGCPPSAEAIFSALTGILGKSRPDLPYELLKYD